MSKLALGLTMYREALNDTASESDTWAPGFTTNLGELDYAAEVLIRQIWAELSHEEQRELLRTAYNVVREHLEENKKELNDGP